MLITLLKKLPTDTHLTKQRTEWVVSHTIYGSAQHPEVIEALKLYLELVLNYDL